MHICGICSIIYDEKLECEKHLQDNHATNTLGCSPIKLPDKWIYQCCCYDAHKLALKLLVRGIHNIQHGMEWTNTFMELNKCKLIVARTRSNDDHCYMSYKCDQHMNPNRLTTRKKKVKGTGCKYSIYISMRGAVTEIKIANFKHNHPLISDTILSFKKPKQEVKQAFIDMFENGLGPTQALTSWKKRIKSLATDEQDYTLKLCDRSEIPDYDYVRHLRRTWFKNKYGSCNAKDVIVSLNDISSKKYRRIFESSSDTVEQEDIVGIEEHFNDDNSNEITVPLDDDALKIYESIVTPTVAYEEVPSQRTTVSDNNEKTQNRGITALNSLRKELNTFLNLLEQNPDYHAEGIEVLNQQLSILNKSSTTARQSALSLPHNQM